MVKAGDVPVFFAGPECMHGNPCEFFCIIFCVYSGQEKAGVSIKVCRRGRMMNIR